MSVYWDRLSDYTTFLFDGLSSVLTFLTSNPLTFTALAILAIDLALSILLGFGHKEDDN